MHVKAHAKIVNIEHVVTVYRLVEQIQILDIAILFTEYLLSFCSEADLW